MFCDISPTCYKIALQKEICKRHIKNFFAQESYADTQDTAPLPCIVAQYSSHLIKRGKGYRDGRILVRNHILPGIGGGLCNLANTIHRVVLVSPLTVTEFHKHSDALAPDEGPRVPFSSGTSVFYNNGDYRFKNEMDQTFQLLLWCDEDNLYAELRCERPLPCRYRIVEEGHHFQKEGGKYYRVSKVYKETLDAQTGQLLHRELVLDNHSEVMYDPALIPGVEKL